MALVVDSYVVRQLFRLNITKIRVLQKRFRYKKKWATNLRKKEATELALEHFDQFYSPVYGKLWPSIRIAILSPQKYCALVNNFHSSPDIIMDKLHSRDAYNVLTTLHKAYQPETMNLSDQTEGLNVKGNSDGKKFVKEGSHEYGFYDVTSEDIEQQLAKYDVVETVETKNTEDGFNEYERQNSSVSEESHATTQDLNTAFIPAQKVFSEKQLMKDKEVAQNLYEPQDIQVNVIEDHDKHIPENLKVYVYPQGDVKEFPEPRIDNTGILEYYLMDAASVLPVIALDPRPSDTILDMCAAPGGKTLAMLQTLTAGQIVANDTSPSRLKRLSGVLQWYCPQVLAQVVKSQRKGQTFGSPLFNKVLVDVPCSTDRHVLLTEENNLFRPGRIADRLQMITTQKELLLSAVKSCKPGGSIVYSTCTLSPTQNDGVIQAAVEDLWNFTNIDVAVENISWISSAFGNTFRFFDKCRFGLLVLPTLRANFGPMYVCKIKRLK